MCTLRIGRWQETTRGVLLTDAVHSTAQADTDLLVALVVPVHQFPLVTVSISF